MGIHDSKHQNVILSCIEELVSYAFRGSRITECQSTPTEVDDVNFGSHKMVKYSSPLLDKCASCDKFNRGLFNEGFLCKGEIRRFKAFLMSKFTYKHLQFIS